jgi:signal transduction histidine kinase
MDEETLGSIFEPGFSTKEARRGGMGFGLFWVKIFLDRFRGEIRVQSQPGQGTTFLVWLPLTDLGSDKSEPLPGEPGGYS